MDATNFQFLECVVIIMTDFQSNIIELKIYKTHTTLQSLLKEPAFILLPASRRGLNSELNLID